MLAHLHLAEYHGGEQVQAWPTVDEDPFYAKVADCGRHDHGEESNPHGATGVVVAVEGKRRGQSL